MVSGRRWPKVGSIVVALAVAGLWAASGASAHVTVAAPGVTVGASDAQIVFRAPCESDTASTVELDVQLPLDHPIAGVLVAPKPGWTAKITQTKLSTPIHTDDGDIGQVVSEIDWTASTGAGIAPGYFGEFGIIGGKLPDDVKSLTFKAIQKYSDGKTVSWTEQAAPGSTAEPDHPAPVLNLATGGDTAPTAGASTSPTASRANGATKGAATTGIVLGAVGVVLGALALALVLMLRRRPAQS